MLTLATAFYSEETWQTVDDRLSLEISEQSKANASQSFRNTQMKGELLGIECSSAVVDDQIEETLAIIRDLNHLKKRAKKLKKEVKKQERIKEALYGSPMVRKIRETQEEVRKMEELLKGREQSNEESLTKMELLVKRRENEIILLNGELRSVSARVDLATVYTTEEADGRAGSYLSSRISSVSGVEGPEVSTKLDLGISVLENLF
jgi:hypothetical protein